MLSISNCAIFLVEKKMGVGLVMVGILVGIKEKEKGTAEMTITREDEAGVGEDGAGEDEVGIATVATVASAAGSRSWRGSWRGGRGGRDGYSSFWKYLVLYLTTRTIILGLGTINTLL